MGESLVLPGSPHKRNQVSLAVFEISVGKKLINSSENWPYCTPVWLDRQNFQGSDRGTPKKYSYAATFPIERIIITQMPPDFDGACRDSIWLETAENSMDG